MFVVKLKKYINHKASIMENETSKRKIALPTFLLDCKELERKLKEFNFHNGGKPLKDTMEKIRNWTKDKDTHTIILYGKGNRRGPVQPSSETIEHLSQERYGFIIGGGRIIVERELKQKDIDVLNGHQ